MFGAVNPLLVPPHVDAMLSGHVHVWEQLSFSSLHPTQIIAGFSGTSEDTVPLPETLPPGMEPAPGAIVDHFSSWVNGFGYMTLERPARIAGTSRCGMPPASKSTLVISTASARPAMWRR